jgi:hypothetical protein
VEKQKEPNKEKQAPVRVAQENNTQIPKGLPEQRTMRKVAEA